MTASSRTQYTYSVKLAPADPTSLSNCDPLTPTQGPVSRNSTLSYTKVKAKSFSSLNKIQVFKYWMEIIFKKTLSLVK